MRQVRSKRRMKPSARRRGWMSTVVLRTDARSSRSRRRRDRSAHFGWAGAVSAGFTQRPVLAVTLAFILCAAATGLVSGGHLTHAYGDLARATDNAFGKLGFAVSHITLQGNERTSPDAIYAALGIRQGQSIFTVDPAAARARLMQLPWVAEAEVRRQFPDAISVVIVERHPFALWKNGKNTKVIERSGAVIVKAGNEDFGRLPVVVGTGAPEAAAPLIDAIAGTHAVAARLKEAERVSERRWNLILDGNVTVKLPEEGWQSQISVLERLIVDKGILERDIESIDLRYPDSYIFRLHNGDSQPVPRERRA
jgi:cell division protein FtsQ